MTAPSLKNNKALNIENREIGDKLLHYLEKGRTPYYVVEETARQLEFAKFQPLHESSAWNLEPGKRYYLIRGGTILAFMIPRDVSSDSTFRIWGSHTDSPALKLRGKSTQSELMGKNEVWGVEIYGSPILNTWLDRPLNIDGVIYCRDKKHRTVATSWSSREIAVIPNAAIHLNREVNKGFQLNRENQLQALLPNQLQEEIFQDLAEQEELTEKLGKKFEPDDLLTMNLFLNDSQSPTLLHGNHSSHTLIQSPKLDNLAMCHAGLEGFLQLSSDIDSDTGFDLDQEMKTIPFLVFFNNEEVGSRSNEGAASTLLSQTLRRISLALNHSEEEHYRRMSGSVIISADMAHAYHPGFDHLYGKNHRTFLDQGIVLKRDSNLHYMNDDQLMARCIHLLKDSKIPYQEYFQHNDIVCGTTIGPHLSSLLGIRTLDLGTSLLAMHSIRETASLEDQESITRFASEFYKCQEL